MSDAAIHPLIMPQSDVKNKFMRAKSGVSKTGQVSNRYDIEGIKVEAERP